MRAHARAPYAFAPALPPAKAGKHAKPGELPGEQAFDYRQPFKVDLGRAAVIAEVLRECGYPDCTADVVTAELARPGGERGIIGRFAADALERYGWRPP
jgi:hypothetical protein